MSAKKELKIRTASQILNWFLRALHVVKVILCDIFTLAFFCSCDRGNTHIGREVPLSPLHIVIGPINNDLFCSLEVFRIDPSLNVITGFICMEAFGFFIFHVVFTRSRVR